MAGESTNNTGKKPVNLTVPLKEFKKKGITLVSGKEYNIELQTDKLKFSI